MTHLPSVSALSRAQDTWQEHCAQRGSLAFPLALRLVGILKTGALITAAAAVLPAGL